MKNLSQLFSRFVPEGSRLPFFLLLSFLLLLFAPAHPYAQPSCITPPAGLVGWWPVDGSMIDISGLHNNGTLVGGASYTASGEVAQGLNLPTANDYATVPDNPSLNFGTGDFTIDAWIKTSNPSTDVLTIVDKRTGSGTNPVGYSFYLYQGKLGFQLGDGNPTFNYISNVGSAVNDGNWHFVGVSLHRDSVAGGKLYLDGGLNYTFDPTNRPGNVTNTGNILIGQRILGPATAFTGLIDEVEIFNRGLSAGEIHSIFVAGTAGKCKTVTICGSKFNDLNCDGKHEANEPGIRSWKINYNGPGGSGFVLTGADGSYCIPNLAPGTYSITEEVKPGWDQTYPTQPYSVLANLGDRPNSIDFGNCFQECMHCDTGFVPGSNLVVNGDFEAGTSGIITSLAYVSSGPLAAGQYSVRTDASTGNAEWCGHDHTTGTGSFMICQGFSSGQTLPAWSQTVTVKPNSKYALCAWVNNLVCPPNDFPDPSLELRVNGVTVASLTVPELADIWRNLSGTWYSGSVSGDVKVEIVATSTGDVGNAFGIDDVSFSECVQNCPDAVVSITVPLVDAWNLLSLPVRNPQPNAQAQSLYPNAISKAFTYQSGYIVVPTLDNCHAFWLKYSGDQSQMVTGDALCALNCFLPAGWSMIGGLSYAVDPSAVTTIPAGSIRHAAANLTPFFYEYHAATGYTIASSIQPGLGYWVFSSQACKIDMFHGGMAYNETAPGPVIPEGFNQLLIKDAAGRAQSLYFGETPGESFSPEAFGLPPSPPPGALDVRFSSQRMLESYRKTDSEVNLRILVESAHYPVTATLQMADKRHETVTLAGGSTGSRLPLITLKNGQSARIDDPAVVSLMLGIRTGGNLPKEFALQQAFPNPFNPSTTIRYQLPVQSRVALKIYNTMGQEVKTLVNAIQEPGYESVEWNSSNNFDTPVASGIYYYRLEAAGVSDPAKSFSKVMKVVLVR